MRLLEQPHTRPRSRETAVLLALGLLAQARRVGSASPLEERVERPARAEHRALVVDAALGLASLAARLLEALPAPEPNGDRPADLRGALR